MYPYYHSYDLPASTPRYVYGPASAYGRADPQYLQALAEEEAARRQYQQALREQENARNRAARARLARQAFESPYDSPSYDSYLAEDDDYPYGYGPRVGRAAYPSYSDYPFVSPHDQRALLQERQRLEQQRRLDALEREREKERQRIVALEEERKRRLLEEERRRRMMLEEEERQRRREEERQRREEQEYLRRQPSVAAFSPLDELLGFRPSRFMQSEMNPSRRARTTSPGRRTRTTSTTQRQQPSQPSSRPTPAPERSASRSPGVERIPISSPKPAPKSPSQSTKPTASPGPRSASPRRFTAEEVDAAEKIQTFWRTHRPRRAALASIASLTTKFEQVKSAFSLPATLDYHHAGQLVSVPTAGWDASSSPEGEVERTSGDASLAFTPTNAPVHAYEEELNRILTKLDGVQSGGDELVRNRRRDLVRKVEREAERIEKVKVLIWRAWVGKKEEAKTMDVDEEKEQEHTVDSPTAEPEQPSEASSVEEMQVDTQESSDTVHADSVSSSDPIPADPVSSPASAPSNLNSSTDSTPTEDVEVVDAQESSEEMQVEPAPPSPADDESQAAVAPEPTSQVSPPTASLDVALEDSEPSAVPVSEEMQVEEEKPHVPDASPEVPLSRDKPNDTDAPMADADDSTPATVPIIIEEPDPDADEQPSEESSEEQDEVSVEVTIEIPQDETAAETIIHPPLSATVSSPTDSLSSPPTLDYTVSEAGDSTPPRTPPASHEELSSTSANQVDGSATPKASLMSAEKLQMLRPLVTMDWDEEIDFF